MAALSLVSKRHAPSGKSEPLRQLDRILVATDFTPTSTPAIDAAIKMAKDNDAELLIAHAYRSPNLIQAESVARGVYEEWDDNLRTDVEKKLRLLVEYARRQLVNARELTLPGSPGAALSRAAEQNGVDLIVMGTHGRTGMSRFFRGSVASRVTSAAPCPVMTVRATER